jgi:hypothetical protein
VSLRLYEDILSNPQPPASADVNRDNPTVLTQYDIPGAVLGGRLVTMLSQEQCKV